MPRLRGIEFSGMPVGTIVPIMRQTGNPKWFLLCDGSAISRTVYADLFAKIGTRYGSGNGTTTFNLPDYRGLFLRNLDTSGQNRDPEAAVRLDAATKSVTVGNQLGTYQEDSIKAHSHTYDAPVGGGSTGYSSKDYSNQTTDTTSSSGSGDTRPKNVSVNFYICFKG